MLKKVKNTKFCNDVTHMNHKALNILPKLGTLPIKSTFIGYSKAKRGSRFHCKKLKYSSVLRPAPTEKWIKNSPSPLASYWRKEFNDYLEVSLDIETYQLHPVSIAYIDKTGRPQKYTPLCLINYWSDHSAPKNRKNLMVDVWTNEDIKSNSDWFIPAWKAAHRFAQHKGLKFRVFRDSFFLSNYFYNAKFIKPYRWLEPNEEIWQVIDSIFESNESIKVSEMLDISGYGVQQREHMIGTIWTLVSMGSIKINWTKKFSLNSEISIVKLF